MSNFMVKQKRTIGRSRHRTAGQRDRRALAATELAVCLPVIVLIVLAGIEACSAIFLKHSLTVAAYEGARVALEQNATTASVKAKCTEILDDRHVKDSAVTVKPASVENLNPGEYVDITITAPCTTNSVVPVTFYRGRSMSATASMMIEY